MIEPHSTFGVLRLIGEINVLLCAALVIARILAAHGGTSHRQRLRYAQGAFVLAFVLPLALAALPYPPLLPVGPQVWSGEDVGRSAAAPSTFVGTTWGGEAREISLDNGVVAFLLVAIGVAAAAKLLWLMTWLCLFRRGLNTLPLMRRIGCVSVVATNVESVPFSAWVFGRAYVVIPEALAASGSPYLAMAVRHELAHHRQRDTIWIQLFQAASAVTFWNPATRAWSRLFTELMELACDEALVVGRRVDPRAYAACLTDMATAALAIGGRSRVFAVTEMVAGDNSFLRRRIEMMLAPRIAPRHPVIIAAVAWMAFAGSAVALQSALQDRVIGADEARLLAARVQPGDFNVVINEQVLGRLNRLIGTPSGREFIQRALQGTPDYRAVIDQRLAASGLPMPLTAVALVESGFRNDTGAQTMSAAGLWMFVPATARQYGLSVEPSSGIDERLDVIKETDAAIAYLTHLQRRFDDWHLAVAAYNQGEAHVTRAIAETGSRDPFVLARQGYLNDYLATVMAAAVVLANPEIVR